MAFGDLKTVTFDHNIVSPYNEFKTGRPLCTEFVGNRWKPQDVEKALPDLGNETMQEAFHKIGDRMSNCFNMAYQLVSSGADKIRPLERDIFEYYSHGEGLEIWGKYPYSLPFALNHARMAEEVEQCGKDIETIITGAMAKMPTLYQKDDDWAFVHWQAGLVPGISSASEPIVCWQLSWKRSFKEAEATRNVRGYSTRKSQVVQIAVGIDISMTYGGYGPLIPGAVSILCSECGSMTVVNEGDVSSDVKSDAGVDPARPSLSMCSAAELLNLMQLPHSTMPIQSGAFNPFANSAFEPPRSTSSDESFTGTLRSRPTYHTGPPPTYRT